jgi:hypothetical protein
LQSALVIPVRLQDGHATATVGLRLTESAQKRSKAEIPTELRAEVAAEFDPMVPVDLRLEKEFGDLRQIEQLPEAEKARDERGENQPRFSAFREPSFGSSR